MFRDGEGGPGSHQVVTGVVRETAGLTQCAGGTDTERKRAEQLSQIFQGNRK